MWKVEEVYRRLFSKENRSECHPICVSGVALAQQEDCEKPTQIANGRVSISVDDERDVVAATYSCDYGYVLVGEAERVCDLDTESWQGQPPSCQKGMIYGLVGFYELIE